MDKNKDLSVIPQEEFARQQKISDIDKWLASEKAHRDLCGTMTWCKYCVKAEIYPCAKAQFREKMETALDDLVDEILEKESAETVEEETDSQILQQDVAEELAVEDLAEDAIQVPEGYECVTRYRRSFRSRVIQNTPVQDVYTELKNALLGYGGVKSRMCQSGENFRAQGHKIAKFVVTGKTLSLFLALSPAEFENSPYRFEDVSEKKSHRETPMRIKITGRRALKQAKELLGVLAQKLGLAEVGCIYSDFHYAYKTDHDLIEAGLIKPYTALVRKKS